MAEYLLEMRGITKEFAGVKAISGIARLSGSAARTAPASRR